MCCTVYYTGSSQVENGFFVVLSMLNISFMVTWLLLPCFSMLGICNSPYIALYAVIRYEK